MHHHLLHVLVVVLHLLLALNEVLNYFVLASQFFIKLSIVVLTRLTR
jgi:hypothetical protein